ncbi:MAG: hypothetical protein R6X20_05825 [Phycisphaerae bacterium]
MTTATPSTTPRRGSTYVLVLGLSAIIMTMALGALALARIQARQGRGTADVAHARHCAAAAVELGRLRIKAEPNWRINYPNGTWGTDMPVGRGTASLQVIDPGDGDLADDDLDPVVLTGTGVSGGATQKIRVTLLADAKAYGCLQTALHADNDLKFNSATVQCDQTVSANSDVDASGADIWADAEAASDVTGAVYHGTTTSRVDRRSMPDPDDVFAEYQSRGVVIPHWAIPWDDGVRVIDEAIFSPNHNPYWPYTTDSEGIYVIQCEGRDIRITDSRIVGTLVLLNAGGNTRIEQAVHWEPAVANYPALLVDGKFTFHLDGGALDEDLENENFNPPHTPYQGQSDGDEEDCYPSQIKGLIYVKDDTYVGAGTANVEGAIVVVNTFEAQPNSLLNLRYDPELVNNPPPGFIERVDMKVAEGSYQRVVD